jgi:ubiquinone/menaquinone biosynthesis C-methylase UbiE
MARSIYAGLMRWLFTRLYREFAWSYDTVAAAVSWGNWQHWTQAVLPYSRGRVLELGCGTGSVQQALAGRPPSDTVVGLDLSPQMLAICQARLERHGLRAPLVRASAEQLPFPAGSFDSVVATFPSEYIASASTLHELRRVLRPAGVACIALGAQLGGPALYRQLAGLAYRLTLQRPPERLPELRATALLEAMQAAGLATHDAWLDAPGGQVYCVVARPA